MLKKHGAQHPKISICELALQTQMDADALASLSRSPQPLKTHQKLVKADSAFLHA
jgi:hypothetical protein